MNAPYFPVKIMFWITAILEPGLNQSCSILTDYYCCDAKHKDDSKKEALNKERVKI